MNGTFNGIPLRKISSIKTTTESSGSKRSTFRVLDRNLPKLEQSLQLNAPGLLILSSEEIEGKIVHYAAAPRWPPRANIHTGYEITLEWKAK